MGPRPFRRAEAPLFFGRSREARLVRDAWLSERVVVLHGAAAVGKTSLLHAGVLPLLSGEAPDAPAGGGAPRHTAVLPVGRLVHQATWPLARASGPGGHRFTLLSSWTPAGRSPDPGRPLTAVLGDVADHRRPYRILGAIDHFEELFTVFPERLAERERLVGELARALRELPLNLLLVVRDDQLAALSGYEGVLSPQPFTYLRLEGLTPDAARSAMTGPAGRAGRRYAPGVAERLVERLRTTVYTDRLGESVELVGDRVAPFELQLACSALWAGLAPGEETVTAESLARLGDLSGVLAAYFDRAVRDVSVETNWPEGALRAWIRATFVTERGTRGTAYRGLSQTAELPNAVVDALVARHVLTEEQRAGSLWYQLAQERLVEAVRASGGPGDGVPPSGQEASPARSSADFRTAAEAALGEGNFVSARRFAEAAARRSLEQGDEWQFANLLAFQGEVARVEGDLESARETLTAARSEFESQQDTLATVRVLTALAEVCLSMGNADEAVELGRQAVSRLPGDVPARTTLAYALWRAGSPANAEAVYNDALDLDRDAARALHGRGRVRIALRDHEGAVADLRRALALGLPRADEDDARAALAEARRRLGA
ncbi:tetratricopeptide repeat protein [Nonomuraea sp. SMC257]|uniref:Tetratricopeptide repeat protein n=1 Tax=Nonomuraea montanisoli TaxID=2741721 RepID=A0A7Y6M917_9ACTN|nr:tetratricopeptide repeat protein [Nonomuraea montanisoli]NUW37984.1 tetratricopeptide repeat protein [Nonomuraea montanisoli]